MVISKIWSTSIKVVLADRMKSGIKGHGNCNKNNETSRNTFFFFNAVEEMKRCRVGGGKEQWPMQKRPAAMSELKRRPQLARWLVDTVDDALQSPTALAGQSSSQVSLHTHSHTHEQLWYWLARDTFKKRAILKRFSSREEDLGPASFLNYHP